MKPRSRFSRAFARNPASADRIEVVSEGEGENRLSIFIENGLWEGRLRPNDHTNHPDRSQASFLPSR